MDSSDDLGLVRDDAPGSSGGEASSREEALREGLLDELVAGWLRLARDGAAPPIERYAAAYPELERELLEFLPGAALLEGLGEKLREAEDRREAAGERIGGFRLEGVLGRGGMGVVYDAVQESLGRRVALKVLPESRLRDRRARERFEREARAAGRLEHPSIVPVYGFGESDGQHWYAMQRIEGVPVSVAIARAEEGARLPLEDDGGSSTTLGRARESGSSAARGSVPPRYRRIARIGLQVADALDYAHSEGVLHRDVKPSNVLLDDRGRAWLADFGLCKTVDADSLTGVDDIVGTMRYMPPERLRGVESKSGDVYGLGLVLYELCTGEIVHPGTSKADLVRRVSLEELPRPRRLRGDVPEDLERILCKATAKVPEERYPNAAAFAADLSAFLDGRPVAARSVGAFYLLRLFVRRNRALVTVAAVGAALLLAASSVYVVGLRGLVEELDAAESVARESEGRARLAAARGAIDQAQYSLARRFLESVPGTEKDWVWRHLSHRAQSGGVVFGAGEGEVRELLEIDGMLVVARPTQVSVHGLVDGARMAVAAASGPRSLVALDGGAVVAWIDGDGQGVLVWDWRSGSAPVLAPGLPTGIAALDADGERLATIDVDGLLRLQSHEALFEPDAPTLLAEKLGESTEFDVELSGRHLLAAGLGAGATYIDLEAERRVDLDLPPLRTTAAVAINDAGGAVLLRGPPRLGVFDPAAPDRSAAVGATPNPRSIAVHHEGRGLFIGNRQGILMLWREGRNRPETIAQFHSSELTAIEPLGSGSLFATGCAGGEVRIGDASPASDGNPGVIWLRAQIPGITAIGTDPECEWIASGDECGGVVLWSLETVKPVASSFAVDEAIRALDVRVTSDGPEVLTVGRGHRVWRPELGAQDGTDPLERSDDTFPALTGRWAPDGSVLLLRTDGAVERWWPTADPGDEERYELLAEIPAAPGSSWDVGAISASGRWIVLAGARGAARLYDLERAAAMELEGTDEDMTSIAVSTSGAPAAVDASGRVISWGATGELLTSFTGTEPGTGLNGLVGLALGREDRWIVTGAESGVVLSWERSTGDPGAQLLKVWPEVAALHVPRKGLPLIAGDGNGRISLFCVEPLPERLPPLVELETRDAETLLQGLARAADDPDPRVFEAGLRLGEAMARRRRYGRLELGPMDTRRLDALLQRLVERHRAR